MCKKEASRKGNKYIIRTFYNLADNDETREEVEQKIMAWIEQILSKYSHIEVK